MKVNPEHLVKLYDEVIQELNNTATIIFEEPIKNTDPLEPSIDVIMNNMLTIDTHTINQIKMRNNNVFHNEILNLIANNIINTINQLNELYHQYNNEIAEAYYEYEKNITPKVFEYVPYEPYNEEEKIKNANMIKRRMLENVKSRAKEHNIPFNITADDIILPDTCPYLDIKINYPNYSGYHPNNYSVDKIVPNLGYIKNNIQVISMLANVMKSNATYEELVLFSKNLIRREEKANEILNIYHDNANYKEIIYKNIMHRKKKKKNYFGKINVDDIQTPVFCEFLNVKIDYNDDQGKYARSFILLDQNLGITPENVLVVSKLAAIMYNTGAPNERLSFAKNFLNTIKI